ncbi:MAG TPA: D-alanyl-D-alanine carboxypeptidase family protein [Rickettsiales bacterium]|nr:D-alanyl-D-alanine carboxypeptidase family protein [Rickettsiales bacterium]
MKILKILLPLLFFCHNLLAQECESRYSALVLDGKNNQVLFENRASQYVYPASLTKVMTLYLTFEALEENKLKLSDKIKISAYAEDISEVNKITTLHLKEGDEVTVLQAIRGAAVKSFNEMAVALAEKIAGNEWEFTKMMNEKARKLKMYHTNFRNASGLHEDGQYSTAYDLARLLVAAQKRFPQYKKYFEEKEFVYGEKKYLTHNHFLLGYKGATGFKTGFTSKAGYNLMASAKRDEAAILGVLVACDKFKIRDEFMGEVFDEAFLKVANRDKNEMRVYLEDY